MTQTSWPFGGQNTTEAQYTTLFRLLQESGVLDPTSSSNFLKTLHDPTGLNVKVQPGFALVRGHAYSNDAEITVPLASPGGSTKYHMIVLRLDPTANTITVEKIGGGTSAPTPTQTDTGTYELPIALVALPASATAVQEEYITDLRTSTGSRIATWTDDLRPAAPLPHQQIGFNRTQGYFEVHDGTNWVPLYTLDGTPDLPRVTVTTTNFDAAPSGDSGVVWAGTGNSDIVFLTNGSGSFRFTKAGLYAISFHVNASGLSNGESMKIQLTDGDDVVVASVPWVKESSWQNNNTLHALIEADTNEWFQMTIRHAHATDVDIENTSVCRIKCLERY